MKVLKLTSQNWDWLSVDVSLDDVLCWTFDFKSRTLTGIARPKVQTAMTINDRCASLFIVDLIKHRAQVLPSTIIDRSRKENERFQPKRKRTAPVDVRLSRTRLGLLNGKTLEDRDAHNLLEDQLQRKGVVTSPNINSEPNLPSIPTHAEESSEDQEGDHSGTVTPRGEFVDAPLPSEELVKAANQISENTEANLKIKPSVSTVKPEDPPFKPPTLQPADPSVKPPTTVNTDDPPFKPPRMSYESVDPPFIPPNDFTDEDTPVPSPVGGSSLRRDGSANSPLSRGPRVARGPRPINK